MQRNSSPNWNLQFTLNQFKILHHASHRFTQCETINTQISILNTHETLPLCNDINSKHEYTPQIYVKIQAWDPPLSLENMLTIFEKELYEAIQRIKTTNNKASTLHPYVQNTTIKNTKYNDKFIITPTDKNHGPAKKADYTK